MNARFTLNIYIEELTSFEFVGTPPLLSFYRHGLFQHAIESRDKCLGEPEGEDELRAGHEKLWYQSLEETAHTLILGHVGQNLEAAFGVLEVSVLDTGLDDVERSGDNERGGSTTDGRDKVLEPCGLVVVGQTEEVLLRESRTTEEGERSGGISGSSPSPTTVETESLICNDLEDTTSAEGLGVCLTLDLEDVQGQQDNLTDTDQTRLRKCMRETPRTKV